MFNLFDQVEKTQAPSQKKKDQAARDGRAAISSDLVGALVLLSGFGGLMLFSTTILVALSGMTSGVLGNLSTVRVDGITVGALLYEAFSDAIYLVGPFLIFLLFVAVVATWLQVGFRIRFKEIIPNTERINPAKNIARIVGNVGSARLLFGFLKVALVSAVLWSGVSGMIVGPEAVVGSGISDLKTLWESAGFRILSIFMKACVVLLILSGIDWLYQRWLLQKSLMMSFAELKDENKEVYGDPQVRSRRQEIRRKLLADQKSSRVQDGVLFDSMLGEGSGSVQTPESNQSSITVEQTMLPGRDGQ